MPKYQNAYFDDLYKDDEDDIDTSQNTSTDDLGDDTDPVASTGSTDWEKRYSDLRRYQQQKEDQWQSKLDAMQEQLEQATKQQLKFPKTPEEVEAWTKKYPEVASIIETMVLMRTTETQKEVESRLDGLRRKEEATRKRTAYQELVELHPDFDEIKTTTEFQNWVSEQPQYIYDALYKNSTDARAAARAIDLYKVDTGKSKPKKNTTDTSRDAARDVGPGGGSAPAGKGRTKWSDSKVDALSDADYDKYEDEIMEAMRSGRYDYDLTK